MRTLLRYIEAITDVPSSEFKLNPQTIYMFPEPYTLDIMLNSFNEQCTLIIDFFFKQIVLKKNNKNNSILKMSISHRCNSDTNITEVANHW